ncbi:glycosyltransferase [Sphingomonas glacialis]|uniref:Glycosyltransferase n=1 Tax=Sphingomonas glacialis TaxID=658225 RepID=A0A502G0C6_9SPHN|nr:glycosyltransferase [Sphingomonas glacialis]
MRQPHAAPRVSVVIANYNGARDLAAAVQSAARQTVSDLEILIADDLSSDASPAIAQELAAADPRIRFLTAERNTGPAGARNRAIAVARGDWIAVLDSDDLMHPSRLEKLIAAAEHRGADIVADDLLVFDDQVGGAIGRFLERPESDGPFALTPERYFAQTVMYGRKPNLGFLKPVFRRAALAAAGISYDERLRIAEDDDIVIRALAAGLRYWIVPSLTYFYRKHSRSISHRTSIADLNAMVVASNRIAGLFPNADRATANAISHRVAATRDALAFQHFLDAAKARRVPAALGALAKRPSAARLLRLPLAARLRRRKRDHAVPDRTDGRHVLFVSRQRIVGRTNGSSTYLLDIAAAVRAAGLTPHLLQPAPSVTGRRPVLRLSPDLAVFETHEVRGVWKYGSVIVSRDLRVWSDALRGIAARLVKRLGVRLDLADTPYPHTITVPWTDADRLFVARHGRRYADAILADYVFQAEAIPLLLRPDAPNAIVMHDLYAERAGSFGDDASRDSVAMLDADQEVALMRQAAAIIAIQEQEAEWVRRHVSGVQVFTAPMAAYPVPAAQPGNDRDVLFVGSNTSPNVIAIEWLLSGVWNRVRAAIPNVRLVIAGSVSAAFPETQGDWRGQGIEFCGMVPDLAPLYRDAGVVISPLTVGSGLKIKLIDALAQGKAIVATSVTLQGVERQAGPAVIRVDDDAGFADAIVALLRDPAERARRAEQALTVARSAFSAETCYGPLISWLSPKRDE